jgi:hypothetical protein
MRRFALLSLLLPTLLLGACRAGDSSTEIAALRAEIDQLKARPVTASAASAAPAPELGQQMLELQIRHARLWQAGEARNWMLSQFQLAELRESLNGVVELNGDHAALQPNRLAEVLPAMMDPALKQMQGAIDAQDGPGFDAAYDAVSSACTGCHAASDHAFLVIQRPQTPMLDNLRAAPLPATP